jgi:hypothetical protein
LAARARRGRCWRGVRRLIRSRLFYLIHFDCYLAFPVCQTIKKQSPVGTKNKPVRGKTKSEKTRRRLLRRKIVQLKKNRTHIIWRHVSQWASFATSSEKFLTSILVML